MNACLALGRAIRWSAIRLLVHDTFWAGSLSKCTAGKLQFFPKTSWLGEKPYTLYKEFLAEIAQANANGMLHLVSACTLFTISSITALCLSHIPLDHADSAAVVFSEKLNFSANSRSCELTNSPPLSVRKDCGWPKIWIQFCITAWMTVSGFLFLKRQAVLKRLAWSIIWRTGWLLMYFISIATVWLNSDARRKPTTGLDGGFRNRLQISHESLMLSTSFRMLSSSTPEFLISFFNRSGAGWANC